MREPDINAEKIREKIRSCMHELLDIDKSSEDNGYNQIFGESITSMILKLSILVIEEKIKTAEFLIKEFESGFLEISKDLAIEKSL